MKLIIDIDKNLYNRIQTMKSVPDLCGTDIVNAITRIQNGKVLPDNKEDVFTRKEELSKEESEWLIDFITKEVMTLDEAITHCEKKAQELREAPLKRRMDLVEVADCEQCAEEHEQLAKWLKELKGYRNEKDI